MLTAPQRIYSGLETASELGVPHARMISIPFSIKYLIRLALRMTGAPWKPPLTPQRVRTAAEGRLLPDAGPIKGAPLRQFYDRPGSAMYGRSIKLSDGHLSVGSAQLTDLGAPILSGVSSDRATFRCLAGARH